MNLYLGIDPGKSGHLVFLSEDGSIFSNYPIPLIGKDYDKQLMSVLLNDNNTDIRLNNSLIAHAVLEDVHATQMGGKSSNFDFGRGKGIWEGLLMAHEIPHSLIAPKMWQKEMWDGAKKQYKTSSKKLTIDTKATSLAAAKMLQPKEDFINRGKSGRGIKIDDGFVDAYLIAEYCRRKFRK